MQCKAEWSFEFLSDTMTKVFCAGDLRNHQKKLLFESEKALMPATQIYVEKKIEMNKIVEERRRLDEQYSELALQLYNNKVKVGERRQFICPCPHDGCRGFLSTQWKCGICENFTCSDCREVIGQTKNSLDHNGEGHVCKPENLASVKAMEKTTKPCPKCGSRIFKIDGCDQMWCSVETCHTAFSWNTGLEISKNATIHNPHYYEWMRKKGHEIPRTPDDGQGDPGAGPGPGPGGACIEMVNYQMLQSFVLRTLRKEEAYRPIRNLYVSVNNWSQSTCLIHRNVMHIIHHLIPLYAPTDEARKAVVLRDNRIEYLMNNISETELQDRILTIAVTDEKKKAFRDVFSTVRDVMVDRISQLYNTEGQNINNLATLQEFVNDVGKFSDFINESLIKIYRRFKMSVKIFDEHLELTARVLMPKEADVRNGFI